MTRQAILRDSTRLQDDVISARVATVRASRAIRETENGIKSLLTELVGQSLDDYLAQQLAKCISRF